MTGITRVSKESIFSDLNNLKVVTTTSGECATSFGFTEDEVFAALEECGLTGEKERFYHGVVLGLIVDLQSRYIITSNHESGFGRYDVMLEPKESRRSISANTALKGKGTDWDILSLKIRGRLKRGILVIHKR